MRETLTALAVLSGACLRRLSRRKMVVQAMVWPGLLSAGSVLFAIALSAAFRVPPEVAVSDPALSAALSAAGLEPVTDTHPADAVSAGRASRAAWREGDVLVLEVNTRRTLVGGQADTIAAEAVLRDAAGAAWRLSPLAVPARSSDFTRSVGWIAGLIGVLFTLYGALVGLGAIVGDHSEGVLESELALPVPAWVHPTARLIAAGLLLSAALGGTLAVLDALVGLEGAVAWWLHSSAAATAAAGIGIAAAPQGLSSGGGFSGPLSRALTLCTGLLGLGAVAPAVGVWLPIAALGALASGHPPTALSAAASLAPCALGAWRFSRGMRT